MMIDWKQKWVKCNFPNRIDGLGSRDFYGSKVPLGLGFLNVEIVQYCVPSVLHPITLQNMVLTSEKTTYSQPRTACEVHHTLWE